MTLFEAFTALVILGLTAVAYLTLFDGAANAAHRADSSSHLVAYAEMAMTNWSPDSEMTLWMVAKEPTF